VRQYALLESFSLLRFQHGQASLRFLLYVTEKRLILFPCNWIS
jgi:hypothetical protein